MLLLFIGMLIGEFKVSKAIKILYFKRKWSITFKLTHFSLNVILHAVKNSRIKKSL